jgi:Ca2+-binding RTX toxin-like protein
VAFDDYLAQSLIGWDGASNPFGSGYLRLTDDETGNAVLEVDANGGGDTFETYITFEGVSAESFTEANFLIDLVALEGYAPNGSGVNGGLQFGSEADEILIGSIGDDTISGLAGNDDLLGGNGADQLEGGNGSDWIDGGFGDDMLSGGVDADSFVFVLGSGDDIISDFVAGTDLLVLTGDQSISTATEIDTDAVGGIDSTLVKFTDGSTVLLSAVLGISDAADLL